MNILPVGILLVNVIAVAGAQQAERTTGRDVVEEEPHPYTISFFLFPHDQETNDSKKVANSQLKNGTNHSESAKVMAADDSKTLASQASPQLQDTNENQEIAAKTISASVPKPVLNRTEEHSKSTKASDMDKVNKNVSNEADLAKVDNNSSDKRVSDKVDKNLSYRKDSDSEKVDKSVNNKADSEKVDKSMNKEADSEKVDKSMNKEADSEKVDIIVNEKADSEKVDKSVNEKADSEKVNKSVNDQADSKNTRRDKAKIVPDEDGQNDDPDISFQHGSVKHPAHEMYPHCHHCGKNSSYVDCIKEKTLKVCDRGLSNICYTRSVKRDKIIHYEMGCADHRTCTTARAKPCRASEKRCFTCCQWSRCNSQPHHKHQERIAAYSSLFGCGTLNSGTWTLVIASFTWFVLAFSM